MRFPMIALNIPEVKFFMNQLLCHDTFDNFLLQEAVIQKEVSWTLDGSINPDFYSADERTEQGLDGLSFIPFGQVRPHCYALIRGKRTPPCFKFVFLLSPANLSRTLGQIHSSFTDGDVSGLFLNLKFQNGQLLLTTGISYRTFSTDKTLEREWDRLVRLFLKNHEIAAEEL